VTAASTQVSTDDRLLVVDALGRLSHAADALDREALACALTEDATWRVGATAEAAVGVDSIAAALRSALPAGGAARRHLRNTVFDGIDEAGAVLTRSYFLLTLVTDGGLPAITSTGIYEDRLVRAGDGWRVAARVASPDGDTGPEPRA
jgi:hypothetical protein